MVDATQLQHLRRLTNAGIADCKRALDEADGDLFAAATSMLTEDDALKLQQSVRVRAMAGQSIKDPVSQDEQQFVDALVQHFVGQRSRRLNVEFLFDLAACFLMDADFRSEIRDNPQAAIHEAWESLNVNDDPQRPPLAATFDSRQCLATVVTMPPSRSEWECDFIVLQHSRRRFLWSTPPRAFAIYRRTKRTDRGLVTIEEMALRDIELFAARRWILEDADLRPVELARVAFAPGLREAKI